MKKLSRIISTALIGIGFLATSIVPVYAASQQTASSGNGIKISPVRTDYTISPGASRSVLVTVQNVTTSDATYQAIVNDFIAGKGENGEPALILDNNAFAPSHSLKRYISAIPNINVPAGQSKEVNITINIPKEAAGGGYFGAVRFAPATGSDTKQNVTLSASVGSLILVKVPGDIKDNITLSSFDVRNSKDANAGSSFFTSNKTLYAVARFNNQGNIQEQPFGKIVLKKGTKVLQTTEVNNTNPKGNVLPDSIRRFSVKLDKVGTWGKYTVEGNFGYGDKGQLLSATSTFYVVPVLLIVIAVVVLLLLLAAIIGIPRAIKRYNQGILRRGGRS